MSSIPSSLLLACQCTTTALHLLLFLLLTAVLSLLTQAMVETVNNLLQPRAQVAWRELPTSEQQHSATLLLDTVETGAFMLADNLLKTDTVQEITDNIRKTDFFFSFYFFLVPRRTWQLLRCSLRCPQERPSALFDLVKLRSCWLLQPTSAVVMRVVGSSIRGLEVLRFFFTGREGKEGVWIGLLHVCVCLVSVHVKWVE